MDSLKSALDRLLSSNSLKYLKSGSSSIQPAYVAFAANSDLCLSLLRSCADYGENVIGLPSIVLPTSRRVIASHDLRERTTRLLSEITDVSVENAVSVQGLSSYQLMASVDISLTQASVRHAKVQGCIRQGPFFRTEDDFWVEHSTQGTLVLGDGCRLPCPSRWRTPRYNHCGATPQAMGESKIFHARSVGVPEKRTSTTSVDATPICD
jgi:hypothetical protein